jgi:hypothetical protein
MKKLLLALALIFVPLTGAVAEMPNQPNDQQGTIISWESGIVYDELERLLANHEWRQANDKTFELILEASGRAKQGWINTESLENFPCTDLKIIDTLWTKYSDNKFGYSVQLPIFIETGNNPGKLGDEEAFDRFGDQVGWRQPTGDEQNPNRDWIAFKENFNYSLDAPRGHLPNPRYEYEVTGNRLEYTTFAERMMECQLVPEDQLPEIKQPEPMIFDELNWEI